MNYLFSILSLAYIAGIFLFADSPMVSDVATFNPYSLLHIPLYGILAILLVLSFRRNPTNPKNRRNLALAGSIALGVAIADEIHQAYLPTRNASMIDVFLDAIGIGLCILVFLRLGNIMGFLQQKVNNLNRFMKV